MSRLLGRTPLDLFPIERIYDMPKEIGIEIECEGRNLPQKAMRKFWAYHHDGSLRAPGGGQSLQGEGTSAEYVCKEPIPREDVRPALDYLVAELRKAESEIVWSNRTSVHVHLNCTHLTLKQILTQACLYYVFEDLLSEYCGPGRSGNLFCLRAIDAEYIITHLRQCIVNDQFTFNNNVRYTSQNWLALYTKGTLEYRMLQGTVDPDTIEAWVNILLRIRDVSADYENPTLFIAEMSQLGPQAFSRKVLGDYSNMFESMDNFEDRLWEGIRLVQDIAYATDWSIEERRPKTNQVTIGDLGVWAQQTDAQRLANWANTIRTTPPTGNTLFGREHAPVLRHIPTIIVDELDLELDTDEDGDYPYEADEPEEDL